MRRADVIDKLRETAPALRACGIDGLYLFGSVARDEDGSSSDVDVFVDPTPGVPFGFSRFMDAYEIIQAAIGEHVDYGTRSGLHPKLRAAIVREAFRIF